MALAQNRLAAGIYFTCLGMPFLQAGEEFARTKKGVDNSYRSSPTLNRLDWERAEAYHALVDYYRGLMGGCGGRFPAGRFGQRHPGGDSVLLPGAAAGGLDPACRPGDGARWKALCVFYDPTPHKAEVPLPPGQWKLLSDGISSSLWRGRAPTSRAGVPWPGTAPPSWGCCEQKKKKFL